MATGRIILLLCLCVTVSFAEQIHVSTNAALSSANDTCAAGDTVMIHAGTYTVGIVPAGSGSPGSPIVYMNYAGGLCSLYVAGNCIKIDNKDYIVIQGIRMRKPNYNGYVVNVDSSDHVAILDCYIYGGAYANNAAYGDWPSIRFNKVNYLRFIGNYVDRLDNLVLTTDDAYRGDAINLYGSATDTRYNIIEGNTVINSSHYGIGVSYDLEGGDSYNIIRNNTVYNCHVGIGGIGANGRTLYEANRSYSPSQMLTYRWGVSFEGTGQRNILRWNMFYDDSVGNGSNGTGLWIANTSMTQGACCEDIDNRYYGNVWLGASRNNSEWHSFAAILDGGTAGDWGRSVHVNDVFAYPTIGYGSLPFYWKDGNNAGNDRDTMRYSLFWTGNALDTVAAYEHGSVYRYTLAQAKAAEATFEASNIEASPLWVDTLSLRGSRSFATSALSPLIDAGGALTVTAASAASGQKVISVGDASYFHFDWGGSPYDRGDSLLIGTERIELDSVDYTANNLIAKSNLTSTISAGTAVHVLAVWRSQTSTYTNKLAGSAPDIGPYEYPSEGSPAVPDTVSVVSPAYGSTQLQPTVLRWHPVTGATKYWLSVSIDDWASLVVNNSAITDTFYSVGGLPGDTTVLWNVAAGNVSGWSAWNSDWVYYTATGSAATDSTIVDWNRLTTSKTMADDTRVVMQNLQRIETRLVLRNPSHYAVEWPSEIIWPGLSSGPALTDTVGVYLFVRDSTRIYGFRLKN